MASTPEARDLKSLIFRCGRQDPTAVTAYVNGIDRALFSIYTHIAPGQLVKEKRLLTYALLQGEPSESHQWCWSCDCPFYLGQGNSNVRLRWSFLSHSLNHFKNS